MMLPTDQRHSAVAPFTIPATRRNTTTLPARPTIFLVYCGGMRDPTPARKSTSNRNCCVRAGLESASVVLHESARSSESEQRRVAGRTREEGGGHCHAFKNIYGKKERSK